MHIAFYRGHQYLAVTIVALGFFFLDVGLQIGHCLLHHTGTLNHLWQEHLALTKQVAHHVHAVHQWSLDHLDGAGEILSGLFGIFYYPGVDTFHQRVFQAFANGLFAPAQIFHPGFASTAGAILIGQLQQALCAVFTAIENHIFHTIAQVFRQVIVHRQLSRIDNAHVHARANSVIEEYRVDRLANCVVTTKGEGHV